jgi:hypothetical protein
MTVCTHCQGTGEEPVHRWVDTNEVNPDYTTAVREYASARLTAEATVREPVVAVEDELRAEVGVTDG